MSDGVPLSLFLARRALCPGCGAALQLEAAAIVVECTYCGCESGIERSLRTLEIDLHAGAVAARKQTCLVPGQAIADSGQAEARCPGCGSPLDIRREQDLADCAHCGSRSKIERSLAPGAGYQCDNAAHDAELTAFKAGDQAAMLAHEREQAKQDPQWNPYESGDISNDHTLRRLQTTENDTQAIELANRLEPWYRFNTWRECMFTRLLMRADYAAAPVADVLFQRIDRIAAAAWQSGANRLNSIRSIVRAAARVFYRADVSERLLHTLGTAHPGAMLKLLLDVADWALQQGHAAAADNALTAAARVLHGGDRQFHIWREKLEPALLAEMLLYRMLYLRPELLAWVLEQVPRWQLADYRVFVRFIDDCAYERPELISLLRDQRVVPARARATFREYKEHLDFLDTLLSPQAREVGMYLFSLAPRATGPDPDPRLLADILPRLAGMLADPALRAHAAWQLCLVIRRMELQDLPALSEFVVTHGGRLPASVWWAWRKVVPDADLPEAAACTVPYEAAPEYPSPLATQLSRFRTRQDREWRFVKQEEERVIWEQQSATELASARKTLPLDAPAALRSQLTDMRRAGSTGSLSLASDDMHRLKHKLEMCYLELDSNGDPRYQDYIRRFEAVWDLRIEQARLQAAQAPAGQRSLIDRLLGRD